VPSPAMVKIDPKELGLLRRLSQLDLESNSSTSTAIIAVLSVVGTLHAGLHHINHPGSS
jgi:hypothetical protein